jgi:hypothetical protein
MRSNRPSGDWIIPERIPPAPGKPGQLYDLADDPGRPDLIDPAPRDDLFHRLVSPFIQGDRGLGGWRPSSSHPPGEMWKEIMAISVPIVEYAVGMAFRAFIAPL